MFLRAQEFLDANEIEVTKNHIKVIIDNDNKYLNYDMPKWLQDVIFNVHFIYLGIMAIAIFDVILQLLRAKKIKGNCKGCSVIACIPFVILATVGK